MLLNPLGVDNHPALPPDPKGILVSVKAFFSVQEEASDFFPKKVDMLSDNNSKKPYLSKD